MRELRQLMFAARALRLESVMVWDHLVDFFPRSIWDEGFTWRANQLDSPHAYFEFQALLGYLTGRAGRVRVGVGVTEPIRRHPVIIAQAMATIAHMTKRAPILGIGSGERENTEPYGLSIERGVSRLEEALQIIRACYSNQRFIDFDGTFFQLDRAIMDLKPPPGRTPEIWLAANGPRMLRLAGIYADGWYPVFRLPVEEYANKLETIRSTARDAGRNPDAITPSTQLPVLIAPDEKSLREAMSNPAVRFIPLLQPADVWRQAGFEHPLGANFRGYIDLDPERLSREDIERAITLVPDEMLHRTNLIGTPEQVIAALREYHAAGCRNVVLQMSGALVSKKLMNYNARALWTIARAMRRD
jgi:phthiodiolone/phenolphthiodiolone dimycocerosates ketoreductase